MEQIKSIQFTGTFSKQNEEDNNPIRLDDVEISFQDSGHILLRLPDELLPCVASKRFTERLGYSKSDTYFSPYREPYVISGVTPEGHEVTANVYDDTSFDPEILLSGVLIKNLSIDHSDFSSKKHKVVYGIISRKHIHHSQTNFPAGCVELSIIPKGTIRNREILLTLSAELTIQRNSEIEEVNFDYCCGITLMLLSFSRGDYIHSIYEIEFTKDGRSIQEYWQGTIKGECKNGGIASMQVGDQEQFLTSVLSKLNFSIVEDSGLFPAMFWYVESFRSSVTTTQLLILFTCLESFTSQFNKTHKSKEKLIGKPTLEKIRDGISTILDTEREVISQDKLDDEEEVLKKYDIYSRKLMARVDDNAVSSLYNTPERLLQFYQVDYKDLFPKLDFARIRAKLSHTGNYGDHGELFSYHMKIRSLLVRLILRILDYEGRYVEHDVSGSLVYKSLGPKV